MDCLRRGEAWLDNGFGISARYCRGSGAVAGDLYIIRI